MYLWYAKSKVCYAYLEDVESGEDSEAKDSSFRQSVWFTRSWTLQELIAPPRVIFFTKDWKEIGSKASLATLVESIANVERGALVRTAGYQVSVAKRMSWAANRQATRVEDMAYSLMGIFGVNMSPVYGEGHKAFTRLQLEIMKVSHDHGVFAWQLSNNSSGILAMSPTQFSSASLFDKLHYGEFVERFDIRNAKADYAMTNFGLHIQLPLKKAGGYFFWHISRVPTVGIKNRHGYS